MLLIIRGKREVSNTAQRYAAASRRRKMSGRLRLVSGDSEMASTLQSQLATKSGDEDDFARGARLEDFFVCARSFRERQLLADDWAEPAIFHASDKRGVNFRKFRGLCRPQSEGENGGATHH